VERRATAALLNFYQAAAFQDFESTLAAVQVFARADARRFVLRDGLRAAALARLVGDHVSAYIEAGQIHVRLVSRLRRELASSAKVMPKHLMAAAVRRLGGRRASLYGPGDRLTLLYIGHPRFSGAAADLLAARSLIYSKLIAKEEIHPSDASPFPHTRNELETDIMVRRLSLDDCRNLFAEVRRLQTADAREAVRRHLGLEAKID